jgi:hypothetical protein
MHTRMATCPYCFGALTEHHRCPRGRLGRRLGDAALTIAVGAGVGAGICYGLVERPTAPLVIATVALGSVLANALRQALGPRV